MSPSLTASEVTLEQARVRLEGAVERLEAAEAPLREALSVLESPRWRTELASGMQSLQPLGRVAKALEEDLGAAHRFLARGACPELAELIQRIGDLTDQVTSLARAHSGLTDAPLEALLLATAEHARSELPGSIAVGEEVVLNCNFASPVWIASLVAGLALAVLWLFTTLGGSSLDHLVSIASGIAALLAVFGAPAVRDHFGGQVVLTNRRVLYQPERADPQERALTEIEPGSLRTGALGTLVIGAPRPLRIRGVSRGEKLAGQIELERWVSSQDAAPPASAPRWAALLLPGHRGERIPEPHVLLLTRDSFVILPVDPRADIHTYLGAVLGPTRVPITLEQLVDALQRLDPVRAEAAVEALATAMEAVVDRTRQVFRQPGALNRAGFDRGDTIVWFEPASYQTTLAMQSMLEGWKVQQTKGIFSFPL